MARRTTQVARTASDVHERTSHGATTTSASPATSIGRCMLHSDTPMVSRISRKYTVIGML